MILRTDNPGHGFHGTVAAKLGEEAATREWSRAFTSILTFLGEPEPDQTTRAHVRNFLDSAYGRHVALAVLDKTPVDRQLEFRAARFRRHFAEIQRQALRGDLRKDFA